MNLTDKAHISLSKDSEQIEIRITAPNSEDAIELKSALDAKTALYQIFNLTNIDCVYYIDDVFDFNPLDVAKFIALTEEIGNEKVKKIKIKDLDFSTIPDDRRNDEVRSKWDNIDEDKKIGLFKQVYKETNESSFALDLKDAHIIDSYFPENVKLIKLGAVQWKAQRNDILSSIPEGKKILLLFDEDLKQAGADFEDTKGIHLIKELCASEYANSLCCCLFTWKIKRSASETLARKQYCIDYEIEKRCFLPLSKERNGKAVLFSDGIKKALLNVFCEDIKVETISLLSKSYEDAKTQLEDIDTYSFDNIIMKSSYHEGIGEKDTLLRICNILAETEIKKNMIEGRFLEKLNLAVSLAKPISDIPIIVDSTIQPNTHPYELRHIELYESDTIINNLAEPIQNGDIFEIRSGNKVDTYILVAQVCDLMVRTDQDKYGKRNSDCCTLLKISVGTKRALEKEIADFYAKPRANHFYSAKYKLPYFDLGKDNCGVVNFDASVLVDMDVLDLAIFNKEGKCELDVKKQIEPRKEFTQPWIKRHMLVTEQWKLVGIGLDALKISLPEGNNKEMLWQEMFPHFTFTKKLGIKPYYNDGHFDFGIRRVKRFREPGAISLLNRYMRHLSREAEEHDFANATGA